MDFKKNTSFSLFTQNSLTFGSNPWKSFSKFSTGLAWSLNPFAKMWARYLLSLDKRATDSLAFNPRFLIITRINSSKSDFDCFGSDLWSILLISTSARIKIKWYLILCFNRHSSWPEKEYHRQLSHFHGIPGSFLQEKLWCLSFRGFFYFIRGNSTSNYSSLKFCSPLRLVLRNRFCSHLLFFLGLCAKCCPKVYRQLLEDRLSLSWRTIRLWLNY